MTVFWRNHLLSPITLLHFYCVLVTWPRSSHLLACQCGKSVSVTLRYGSVWKTTSCESKASGHIWEVFPSRAVCVTSLFNDTSRFCTVSGGHDGTAAYPEPQTRLLQNTADHISQAAFAGEWVFACTPVCECATPVFLCAGVKWVFRHQCVFISPTLTGSIKRPLDSFSSQFDRSNSHGEKDEDGEQTAANTHPILMSFYWTGCVGLVCVFVCFLFVFLFFYCPYWY